MTRPLTYVAVTPARDDAANLRRLASSLVSQTRRPDEWIVVDGGSVDDTRAVVAELAAEHDWIRSVSVPREPGSQRGAPIVRAFVAGLGAIETSPDVVVKLDADLSMEPDYFERLLGAFAADPELGMASGSAWEQVGGAWRQRHMTRSSVWGACRAYRRACLDNVLPLEERMGWDSVDEFRANVCGWRTRTVLDRPLRHHRVEGERDGSRRRAWAAHGRVAHYLGYRPWYLVVRALYRGAREPAALAMIAGYAGAAARREERCTDADALGYLRQQQTLRRLPLRIGEALGLRLG